MINMLKLSATNYSMFEQNNRNEFLSQITSLLDAGSEYIGIISKNGRLKEVFRKENDLNLTEDEKEMFFMSLQLHITLQSDFDGKLGSINYLLIKRQNSRFVLTPTSEGFILVKLNKFVDPFLIINKIPGILDSYKQFLETSMGVCP